MAGLDLPEMGAPGYTNDDVVMHGGLRRRPSRGAMSSRPPILSHRTGGTTKGANVTD